MGEVVRVRCSCGGASCRIREIRIDPEERNLTVEMEGGKPNVPQSDALMYLDAEGFRALIRAGKRGLRNPSPQNRKVRLRAITEGMASNPLPPGAPRFTREELHERD